MVFLIIPIPSQTHVHPGNQHQLFAGDGVFQLQTSGAEHLAFQPQLVGSGNAVRITVLGIAPNGVAHVSAMDPQLMGASGDGMHLLMLYVSYFAKQMQLRHEAAQGYNLSSPTLPQK